MILKQQMVESIKSLSHQIMNKYKVIISLIHLLSEKSKVSYSNALIFLKKKVNRYLTYKEEWRNIFHWNIYTLIIICSFIVFYSEEKRIYEYWLLLVWDYMSLLYNIINENSILNFISFTVLLYSGIKILSNTQKDLYISINKLLIILWTGIILFRNTQWEYLTLLNFVSYKTILYTLIVLYIIIVCKKIYHQIRSSYNKDKENSLTGFATSTLKANQLYTGWTDYAATLSKRILSTDVSREVFSIGIASPWGTGKTTFLEEMKDQLKEDAFVVCFNPWDSLTSNQIILDYFNSLKDNLTPYYSNLSHPIAKYANMLAELEINDWSTKIAKLLGKRHHESLDLLKQDVENCIAKFDKPIVVLIDDLDRLRGDELFEVLRLIRNTAKFKNMVYIVTYDRDHIIEMLTERGVPSSKLYIEKIFALEISLPAFENSTLPNLLYKELIRMLPAQERIHRLFITQMKIRYGEQNIVSCLLKNFRNVKRFSNILATNINYLIESQHIRDIDLPDFFWLEIIHYSNPALYQILKSNPEFILKKIPSKNLEPSYYYWGTLKKEPSQIDELVPYKNSHSIISQLEQHGCKNIKIDMYEFALLEDLFSPKYKKRLNTIRYIEHYPKYFAFRVMKNQISRSEFMFELSSSNTASKIEEWSKSNKINSLVFYFSSTNTIVLDESEAKQFLTALFHWIKCDTQVEDISNIVNNKLEKSQYKTEIRENLSLFVRDLFNNIIPSTTNRLTMALILSKLFAMQYFDEEMGAEYVPERALLTNSHIKALAQINFNSFIAEQPDINPLDIVNINSKLGQIVRKSCKSSYYYHDRIIYLNLVLDNVRNLFSHHQEIDHRAICEKLTVYSDPCDGDREHEALEEKIKELFESLANYKKFIIECTNISEDDREVYFERIGISSIRI